MAIKQLYPDIKPTLNLDFVNSKQIDPIIDFTRPSRASYYNENGRLSYAEINQGRINYDPVTGQCKGLLIEESRTNLLTYSEQFNISPWSTVRASIIPNCVVAPDGTMTANKFVGDLNQTINNLNSTWNVVSGKIYTFSGYLKAGEIDKVRVGFRTDYFGGGNSTTIYSPINLTTGTYVKASYITYMDVIYIENGWWRFYITATATGTSSNSQTLIELSGSDTSTGLLNDYVGDGKSGIYVWGLQIEEGSFPTTYIPSTEYFTSRSSKGTYYDSSGILKTSDNNVSRYSYNPEDLTAQPKLILEPERTNLLLKSEEITTSPWYKNSKYNWTSNAGISPDGTMNADFYTPTLGNSSFDGSVPSQSVTLNAGGIYTVSAFFKCVGQTDSIRFLPYILNFNTTVGGLIKTKQKTFTATKNDGNNILGPNLYGSVKFLSNDWVYASITFEILSGPQTFTFRAFPYIDWSPLIGDDISGMYLWGVQLEQGSYPTSYIKTEGSQVTRTSDVSTSINTTRAADYAVIKEKNFSKFFNIQSNKHTVVWVGDTNNKLTPSDTQRCFTFIDSNNKTDQTANSIRVSLRSYGSFVWINRFGLSSSINYNSLNPLFLNNQIKISTKFNTTKFNISLNGEPLKSVDIVTYPIKINILELCTYNKNSLTLTGHIKQFTYYPTEVSDEHLQQLSK